MTKLTSSAPPVDNWRDPYSVPGFAHAPWVLLIIAPFRFIPLELSTLLQSLIYCGLIALIIRKLGGDRRAVIVTLSSFIMLDAVLEMNVDWVVLVGLVVPLWASGPFVFVKPQVAAGWYLGLSWRAWLLPAAVSLVVLALSVVIWGFWPLTILERSSGFSWNAAPAEIIPYWLSVLIGIGLTVLAYRRQDPALGVLAWLFYMPYISFYSLVLHHAVLAVRLPKLALIINVAMWAIYVLGFAYVWLFVW